MRRTFFALLAFTYCSACAQILQPIVAGGGPWLTGWSYRKVVTVSNTQATPLSDYQVPITLSAANFSFAEAQSDGSDLRVTDTDGTTIIPYTITAYDSVAQTGTIWVRVANVPASAAKGIFLYWGNASASTFTIPPAGPFEKAATAIIAPSGHDALAENIIWDATTSLYWMAFQYDNITGSGSINLAYSSDLATWTDNGAVASNGHYLCGAHLLLYAGTYYLFAADSNDSDIKLWTASAVAGTYSLVGVMLDKGTGWEAFRVSEPYVFQRGDGTWMMLYMGDSGSVTEQVGFATAASPSGPWTKYGSNPVLAFGAAGSYDAGTIADPHTVLLNGTYYIFYAASSTNARPWLTAYATTTDWVTFTKHNLILAQGDTGAFDAQSSFRGAMSSFGDYYYLPYTGYDGTHYSIGLAKQYNKSTAVGYPPDQVFGFYDDFNSATLSSHWHAKDVGGSVSISAGSITLTSGTNASRNIISTPQFPIGTIVEVSSTRTALGTTHAGELGLCAPIMNLNQCARLYDNGSTSTKWKLVTMTTTSATVNSAHNVDTNPHVQSVWRKSTSATEFKVDASYDWEEATQYITTNSISAFLMAYGGTAATTDYTVDWIRVRNYSEPEPTVSVGMVVQTH